jgi:hypothetical protein
MGLYSYNDWRVYLAHRDEEKSKYDWSTGTNPPDYNHDYYEKHKEEILAKRKSKDGAVRDFGGNGVGYKAKTDDGKSYENDEDWSDELTDEEKKNIQLHNEQVEKNISDLEKTVNDYITANKGKLSDDQISKLQKDLATQTEIAREQMISTKNSDDYDYMMSLRKNKSNSKSKSKSSSSSSNKSSNKKASSNTNKSNTKTNSTAKSTTNKSTSTITNIGDLKRQDYADMANLKKKSNR